MKSALIYKMIPSIFLSFCLMFFALSEVNATDYYVSTSGSDSNNGQSLSSPFKTISAASLVVNPGDTVNVREGSYGPFSLLRTGTQGNYITFKNYNNEKVIINSQEDGILLRGVSFIVIRGFEVKGATGNYGAGIRVVVRNGVAPNNNIIEDNIVHDNLGVNTFGIMVENGSYNIIRNNEVYNNYVTGIKLIAHDSISPNGITGNEITNNISHHNVMSSGNSDGIALEGSKIKNTLIANNISYANADDGIDTWNTSENIVRNNVAYSQRGTGDGNGFKAGGSSTGGNNLVVGNVSYDNKANGFDSNGSGGNRYYNNVSYGNTGFGFEDGWKDSSCSVSSCKTTYINNIGYNNVRGNFNASEYTNISNNNLWFSDSGGAKVFYKYSSYTNLFDFYLASNSRLDNPNANAKSSISSNPLFLNLGSFDFRLQPNSPAINKGDPDNPAQITVVGIPDIGAFEYTGTTVPTTPPTTPPTVPPTNPPTAPPTTPPILLGDLNNDNIVNSDDYQIFLTNFGKVGTVADINKNGKVDIFDYNILVENYGKSI